MNQIQPRIPGYPGPEIQTIRRIKELSQQIIALPKESRIIAPTPSPPNPTGGYFTPFTPLAASAYA